MIFRLSFVVVMMIAFLDLSAQFGPDVVQSVKLTAEVDAENSSITLNWIIDEGATSFDLYRRRYNEQTWGSRIGQFGVNVNSYLDTDIVPNERYEYKIQKFTENDVDGFGYILTGIAVEPIHFEGNALLVVTESTHQNVESKIAQYQKVLSTDGWSNRLLIIPDGLLVSEVKSQILNEYNTVPFTTCVLLGDVPIALSGDVAPDGHTTQGGAWAADLFYGDIDGEWTDSTVTTTVSPWPVNNNIPGDGKWDQSTIPSKIDIAMGRIDFSNLPVFEEDEYELLSKYIDKNIAYRTKEKETRRKAAIYNINPWEGGLGQNGIRNYSTMVGPDNILYDDFDPLWEESYMWLYAASSGFHDLLFTVTSSEEFANRSLKAVFTNFFGSRFGNYDYTNNFMRSALGSGDVLSSCYVGAPHWYFHPMAMGYSLGHATITTQNNDTIYNSGNNKSSIHVNLLGDPTLRLYPMEKISPIGLVESPLQIDIAWSPTSDAEGYFVYRKTEEVSDFELLNAVPITGTTFQDPCPEQGQTYTYMVRATRLETTPSGTYYNLSTGAMESITASLNNNPIASFDFNIVGDEVLLIDLSQKSDSVIISGVEEVINQNDGTHILVGAEQGDIITLIAINGCGSDTTSLEFVISSVTQNENTNVSVFPNPFSSMVHIKSENRIIKWRLNRFDGTLIREAAVDSTHVQIDATSISRGLYYFTISTNFGETVKRVIIQ